MPNGATSSANNYSAPTDGTKGNDMPSDEIDAITECPRCGSRRTERFKVDGFTVFTCADCGMYDDRVDYLSRGGAPWD